MAQNRIPSCLRMHRLKSGLSQLELAQLVGYQCEDPVSRHEQATSIPPLLIAFAYEAIFRVPVSELFPGIYDTVDSKISQRISELERRLQEKSAQGREGVRTARKLQWFCARQLGIKI